VTLLLLHIERFRHRILSQTEIKFGGPKHVSKVKQNFPRTTASAVLEQNSGGTLLRIHIIFLPIKPPVAFRLCLPAVDSPHHPTLLCKPKRVNVVAGNFVLKHV